MSKIMAKCVCTSIFDNVISCEATCMRDAPTPWICTRERGHTGEHIACGGSHNHKMFTWNDDADEQAIK